VLHQIPQSVFNLGVDLWRTCGTPEGVELYAHAAKTYSKEVALVALEWIDAGAPRLTVGHHHAASLICTRIPEEILLDVVAPWPCFLLDVPPGLLDTSLPPEVSPGDVPAWVLVRIMPQAEADTLRQEDDPAHAGSLAMVYTLTPSGRFCGITAGHAARMCNPRFDSDETASAGFTDAHTRATRAVLRLVGALLVELAAEPTSLPSEARQRAPGPARSRRGEPSTRTFAVRAPTGFARTTDFRGPVREWIAGRRKSPVVQGMVCAHFRRAPCGVGGKDRRTVRVWSYWRGPEDAPIAFRERRVHPRGALDADSTEPAKSP